MNNNSHADDIPLVLNSNANKQTNHKVILPAQQIQLPGNSQLALISATPNNGKLLTSINRVRQADPTAQNSLDHLARVMVTSGGKTQ